MALIIESNVPNENYSLIFRFHGVAVFCDVDFIFSRAFYRCFCLSYTVDAHSTSFQFYYRIEEKKREIDRKIELCGARNELINNQWQ